MQNRVKDLRWSFLADQGIQADHITSNFFIGCLPQILLGPFLNEYLDPIMARFSNQFVWWL